MRTEDVLEHLRRQPFEPFRIYMSDGATLDIGHPDLCMVGRSTAYVGLPDPEIKGAVMRVAHSALIHITRIEPLNGQRSDASSGQKRTP